MGGTITAQGAVFFNDTATAEIYALSLHDALPTSGSGTISGSTVGTVAGGGTISGGTINTVTVTGTMGGTITAQQARTNTDMTIGTLSGTVTAVQDTTARSGASLGKHIRPRGRGRHNFRRDDQHGHRHGNHGRHDHGTRRRFF